MTAPIIVPMISLEQVYWALGALFAAFAVRALGRRRIGNAAFWGLLALSFIAGSDIGDLANGVIVLALVGLGAGGALRPAADMRTDTDAAAARHGNWLFGPALLIPAIAIAGTFALPHVKLWGHLLADPKQLTLISLAIGIAAALIVAMLWLRPRPATPIEEGLRLADSIGWAAVLPQMLAALGAVFALSGAGDAVGVIATHYLPLGTPFAAVAAYGLGMALFTAAMGNAFAAFPVMTAAIGIPLIVKQFGGDPAIMGSLGMLCGFCGTLTTPMAANFNIVPAALLELPNRNGVIAVQIPTALIMLAGNITLMALLVYRF